jgi:tRNA (Thr-GGU) A37 N-methylase
MAGEPVARSYDVWTTIERMSGTPVESYELHPVGVIRSVLQHRSDAPRQGDEGTWLHLGRRDVLKVHPRNDASRPLSGVFATRSPDRPNPVGLHPVTVKEIAANRLLIGPIEAVDGTPVVDIKPVLVPRHR